MHFARATVSLSQAQVVAIKLADFECPPRLGRSRFSNFYFLDSQFRRSANFLERGEWRAGIPRGDLQMVGENRWSWFMEGARLGGQASSSGRWELRIPVR